MRTNASGDDTKSKRPQLAVWLCTQPEDRHARGASAVADIARCTVDHYTDRGDLVLDPDCRAGLLVEQAALLGRRTVGASGDHHLAACAANRLARHHSAVSRAAVVISDNGDELPYLLATQALPQLLRRRATAHADNVVTLAQQRFALILTELTAPHDHTRGYLREAPPLAHLAYVCPPLLKAGGFLALLLSPLVSRRRDQPRRTIRVLEQAGLSYWQHVIALTGTSELIHRDLLVFRRDDAAASTDPCVLETRERRAA